MTDPVPCPECGSRPHPNDRYCPECGAQIPAATTAGVRAKTGDDASGLPPDPGVASAAEADAAIGETGERQAGGSTVGDGDGPSAHIGRPSSDEAGGSAGAVAGAATSAAPASPSAFGRWSPRVASGKAPVVDAASSSVAGTGSVTESVSTVTRDAGRPAIGASDSGLRAPLADADAPATVERPISPAAAAAAAAAVAAANDREAADAGRSAAANGEDPGWFAATSAGSMVALGLLLVAAGILLVLVGKIDRTGTIGIFGLLIAVGGVFMIPLAAIRAIADRVL